MVTIDGYEDVPVNDEKALKKAVAHQPVSVAIEAGGREFQLYQSVCTLHTTFSSSISQMILLALFNQLILYGYKKKNRVYSRATAAHNWIMVWL